MPKNLPGHHHHIAVIKRPRRNIDLITPATCVQHLRPAIRAETAFGHDELRYQRGRAVPR